MIDYILLKKYFGIWFMKMTVIYCINVVYR